MSVLKDVFIDLMAYVLFFEATCAQQCPPVSEVREKVKTLLDAQGNRIESKGILKGSYREACFAVLSWVDESVLNSTWPHRNQWQHLMLEHYGTLNAGEEFFQHLESLPPEAKDIREIYYLCLRLGFHGEYALGDDLPQLREVQRTLYRQLPGISNDVLQKGSRLFPEAYQAVPEGNQGTPPRVRLLWFGLAFLLPLLFFVVYSLILRSNAIQLLEQIGVG